MIKDGFIKKRKTVCHKPPNIEDVKKEKEGLTQKRKYQKKLPQYLLWIIWDYLSLTFRLTLSINCTHILIKKYQACKNFCTFNT